MSNKVGLQLLALMASGVVEAICARHTTLLASITPDTINEVQETYSKPKLFGFVAFIVYATPDANATNPVSLGS